MPPKKRKGGKGKSSRPAAAGGGDRLGTLPDDVLHHLLSFLPAEDAVRTSVLARRWRELWKSATGLRIVRQDVGGTEFVKAVREFVDHLLLLRGGSPLDTCELSLSGDFGDDTAHVKLWIRHILMCKVRVLRLDIVIGDYRAELDVLTLISAHLKKLQLSNIVFTDKLFDLSCCPTLEVLEINDCSLIRTDKILSQSLKCLSIDSDSYFDDCSRLHIDAPNLHSLHLEIGHYRTPVLERMPSLVDAFVKICEANIDGCYYSPGVGDCENQHCFYCYEADGATNRCVLLHGLSEAQNLALISETDIFIFRRDLKWCPVFANLKTLLLNEYWCVPGDLSALAYMLEHSPILEKLTFQLFCEGPNSKVKIKGIPDPKIQVANHLQIVEVKCDAVGDEVLNVLDFLSKLGIWFRIEKLCSLDLG